MAVALVSVTVGCEGAGWLEPVRGEPVDPEAAGVHFVEPFDYHYPDEGRYEGVAERVELRATLGQTVAGAFVFVPEHTASEIRVRARDLQGPAGSTFPAENVRVQVVTFMDRARDNGRLETVWRGGIRRGSPGADSRGFHQDAKVRLPLVPAVLVEDAVAYGAALDGERFDAETGDIELLRSEPGEARASALAGEGRQFWITVTVPEGFAAPGLLSRYEGVLELEVDGVSQEVPLALEVIATVLDRPGEHGMHVGIMSALDTTHAELHPAILDDLREHGVDALRIDDEALGTYETLRGRGITTTLNLNTGLDAQAIAEIESSGTEPYLYHSVFDPTDAEVDGAIADAAAIHDRGGLFCAGMTLDVLQAIVAEEPVDLWVHGITTYELDARWQPSFDGFLAYLDGIRADPSSKLAPVETHYAEVFNGHAPHLTRLMMGFWLLRSGLDGGMPWGYAEMAGTQPFSDSEYDGVVFPVRWVDGTGAETGRGVLPTYTWEAYRAGVDDLRLGLTVRRLLDERGSEAQRDRYEALLGSYDRYYDDRGDRVDYRNRESDVRITRQALLDLLVELNPE